MFRRLILSSAASAIWLVLAFVTLGALYMGIGYMVDPYMNFHNAWGHFRFDENTSISRVGVSGIWCHDVSRLPTH